MNAVATDTVLDDAIVALNEQAYEFLCAAQAGLTKDPRATAVIYMHRLREPARTSGNDLASLPAYDASITNWRAVATLAGSVVEDTTRAG